MPEGLLSRDPRRIGPYEVTARLGSGGMGTVYLGRTAEDVEVAIKVVRPEYALDDEFRARFRSEVERARQVPPFCTAEVLDADPGHDPPYLVVEYVDGPSLAEVVERRGRLSAGNLHGVAIGVATALTAIHGAGVIHRDLKPRNVLLPPGNPKVIDFGIARAFEPTSRHTRTGQMLGTVAYMAPERFDDTHAGRAVTPAADVFAWGAVVAYAGTGRTPFEADSAPATAMRILSQPPVLEGLPHGLADLVALALAKEPEDRPTARELLDLLLAGGGQRNSGVGAGADAALAEQPALRQAAVRAARHAAPDTGDPRPWHAAAAPTSDAGSVRPPMSGPPTPPPGSSPGPPRTPPRMPPPVAGPPTPPPGPPRPLRRGRTAGLSGGQIAAIVVASIVSAIVVLAFIATGVVDAMLGSGEIEPEEGPGTTSSVVVSDPLSSPGPWRETFDRKGSSCAFGDGDGMLVSRPDRGDYRCTGPKDAVAGSHDISFDVRLLTTGACAAMWFDAPDAGGYRFDVCRDRVALRTARDLGAAGRLDQPLANPLAADATWRVRIEVTAGAVAISIDGDTVADAPMSQLTPPAGTVVLGITVPSGKGEELQQVQYANVDILAVS